VCVLQNHTNQPCFCLQPTRHTSSLLLPAYTKPHADVLNKGVYVSLCAVCAVCCPQDVFAVHGMGGVVGSILTPVFASSLINPNIQSGALHGNWRLVGITLLSIVVLIPWLLLSTLLCLFLTNCFFTLRVTSECIGSHEQPRSVRCTKVGVTVSPVTPCTDCLCTCHTACNLIQCSSTGQLGSTLVHIWHLVIVCVFSSMLAMGMHNVAQLQDQLYSHSACGCTTVPCCTPCLH
jgi:hypothetical protein